MKKRPVKYKVTQRRRKRLMILLITLAVILVLAGALTLGIALSHAGDPGKVPENRQSDEPTDTEAVSDQPTDTEPLATETEPKETEPPVTTEPPATEPPVTEPPVTEPATEPPETESPVTEPPETEPKETEPVIPDVGRKDVRTNENYRGGYLDLSQYSDAEALKTAAEKLKKNGYSAVMLDLKKRGGVLTYMSSSAMAKSYGANPASGTLALAEAVKILHDCDLYVTARVSAFCDDYFAKKNNAPDVLMNETNFRYSDGTYRWASVYSERAQSYVLAIIDEIAKAGIDELLLSDFGLPGTGNTRPYVLKETKDKTEQVTAFVNAVKAKLSDIPLSLQIDPVTVKNGADASRGYDLKKLSALCEGYTAELTVPVLSGGVTLGGCDPAKVKEDPAAAVKAVLTALENVGYPVRPLITQTGKTANDKAQRAAAAAFGNACYQMTK